MKTADEPRARIATPSRRLPRTRRGRRGIADLLGIAVSLGLAACSDPAAGRSLLLVTLDTTRPDALAPYAGPGEPRATPVLARLAAEGVVFEQAQSSIPITLPSHATLLTGLYPPRHGVRDNGRNPLPAEARTLAELARESGRQTAAFVGAVVLDPAFGLDQGFERYSAPQATGAQPAGHEAERPASEVVGEALAWLDARDRGRPFFLWVHLYDPHTPYEPPDRAGQLEGLSLRQRYDGEVAYADSALEPLFTSLRDEGALERCLVVVAADHGEAFGEHGEETHGVHCYQTTLHVPLLVRAPFWERGAAGTRSDELVGLVDLLPTACEALGLAAPAGLDGVSFWSAPPPPTRGLYFESYYGYLNFGWSPVAGWIEPGSKYLHSSDPHLFDPRADPGETQDLLGERPEPLRRAQRALVELAQRPRLDTGAGAADEQLLGSLRGLGYASIGGEAEGLPHPLEETGLPSPESMIATYEIQLEALEAGKRGELREAERLLRRVLEANPKNPFALDQLAACLIHRNACPEAIEVLRRLLALPHAAAGGGWFKLARCLEAQGQQREAIDALKEGLALTPDRPAQRSELVRLLRQAGRGAEADEVERRSAAPEPGEDAAGGRGE